jgi:flagellar hook-associated protein 2
LSTATNFFVKKAATSNETALGVSASSTAPVGTHAVAVHALARASTLASASFNDTDTTTVGIGTLRITVGATTTNITLDGANNTLAGVRDAINNSGADVTATTILENSGGTPTYRLAIIGKSTGTVNAVTVDASGLAVGGGDVALGVTTTQTAQDTSLTVDGIAVTRSTNTVSDVLPGVTLDVKDTVASPVQITLNNDIDAIKTQLNDFVKTYNEVMSFIAAQTKYDSSTRTAGPLIGESSVRALQTGLQRVLATPVAGTPSILADVGVTTQRDGTLTVDDAKLTSALQTNLSGVSNLFLAATNGVAKAAVDFVNTATRAGDGIVSGRISSIQDNIRQIGDQIARKTANLDTFRDTLVRRFASLETLVSQLQSQGQFLTQRLAQLNA